MTCEVVVMNRYGVALAADSAVCRDDKTRIFQTGEKLHQIGIGIPIAMMTYGDAFYMGVPWEVIIASYNRQLDETRFGTLQEYVDDFIAYLTDRSWHISDDHDETVIGNIAREIWSHLYAEPFLRSPKGHRGKLDDNGLCTMIQQDQELWEQHDPLLGIDTDFADQFLDQHKALLSGIADEVFAEFSPSPDTRRALLATIRHVLTKCSNPPDTSHVVISGMGEQDWLPSLFELSVGPPLGQRPRITTTKTFTVSDSTGAGLFPFGQTEAIDMVLSGCHQKLKSDLLGLLEETFARIRRRNLKNAADASKLLETYAEDWSHTAKMEFSTPIMATIDGLPRADLAMVAEKLVSFAAFAMWLRPQDAVTISSPVNVAFLSKADGFTWTRHKEISKSLR